MFYLSDSIVLQIPQDTDIRMWSPRRRMSRCYDMGWPDRGHDLTEKKHKPDGYNHNA